MNAVREWTAAICMAALAAAVLQGLSPDGSMGRMMRVVIGAVVVCALIVPLQKVVPELLWSAERVTYRQEDSAALQDTVQDQMADAAKQSIQNLVVSELGGLGIKCIKVDVDMDIKEDNSIDINSVRAVLASSSGGECARAKAHLEKTLGLRVEVSADGGG